MYNFPEFIFAYVLQALEEPPQEQRIESDQFSFSTDNDGSFLDDFSDIDSFSDNEVVRTVWLYY